MAQAADIPGGEGAGLIDCGDAFHEEHHRDGLRTARPGGPIQWQGYNETGRAVLVAREFHPVRIDEVQDIVRKLNTHNRALPEEKKVHLRAIGHGRTWSSVFLDDNDWLLYTSFLVMDDNSAVRPVFQENGEYKKVGNRHLVQVSAGLQTGDFAHWMDNESEGFREAAFGLSTDVVLDSVRYGGVIATGCHGTSWKHPPIGDQIYEVTVVDGSGRIVTYREDIVEFRWSLNGDPISTKTIEGVQAKAIFDAVRCSFGLFGVVCYITFKTDSGGDDDGDPDPPHARVEHIKKKMKDILAVEYLRDLVTESYGVEIFWFPINHFFNGGTWAYGDESMWVKKYTRVSGEEGAVQVLKSHNPKQKETYNGAYDPIIGPAMTWIWPQKVRMNKLHDLFRKPLTPLFGKLVMGLSQNETVTSTLSYAQHFQKSIDNMKMLNFECAFNLEKGELEDFKKCADILRAVGKTVEENWALGQCPMNLCLEVRFTKATAMTLSPAFSEDLSDHFVWVNVSAMYPSMAKPEAHEEEIAEYLKKWDAFCREVFKRWKGIDNHVKPHWAKWVPSSACDWSSCGKLVEKQVQSVCSAQFERFQTAYNDVCGEGRNRMFLTKWLGAMFLNGSN